jgi:hypothetical protein
LGRAVGRVIGRERSGGVEVMVFFLERSQWGA